MQPNAIFCVIGCENCLSMTDLELLLKIKKNPSDFSELFKLYYKPIFNYVLRRTGCFDDTADIAADTFYNAFRHINDFSYRGISIKVWLYRIATNEVNLYFRFKKKHNTVFKRISFEDKDIFNQYLQEDRKELELELQQHDQFMAVLESLKTLPLKYQEVIALRFFEGKENKELAEILNMKEGTIKSLLSRGLEKLRKKCNRIEPVTL